MNKLRITAGILLFLTVLVFHPVLFSPSSVAGNFGDVYQHYYPMKYLVTEHVVCGRLPLWNPYIFTGQPLLANPQSAVFYPMSPLFYILPLALAFDYFEVLHILLGALFFFLLLKYYGRSNSASLSSATAYCFSSFLLYKIPAGHPAALSGYIWLPIIILFTENLAAASSRDSVVLLAAALAFQYLSGHTFPLYISLVFLLVFAACRRGLNYRYFAAACVTAVLLTGVQLLPSYELSQASETWNIAELARNYSLRINYLVNFILPDFYGNVMNKTFIQPMNPSYFFENHGLYIGIIPFIVGAAGSVLAVRSGKYFYPVLFFSGIFLAVGFHNPVYGALFDIVPGFNFLRVPARFIYLSLVSLLVLSSFAWDRYARKLGWIFKLALFLLIFIDLFAWAGKFIYAEDMAKYRKSGGVSGFFNPLYRVLTDPGMIMPNKSMLYHHFNLNGYEAIFLKDFTRYLGMQEKFALDATGLCRSDLNSPLAKAFSVKYILTPNGRTDLKLAYTSEGGLNVYELPGALPRVFFARGFKLFAKDDLPGQLNYLASSVITPDNELLLVREQLPERLRKDYTLYAGTGTILSYECLSDRIISEFILNKPAALVFTDAFYNGWLAASAQTRYAVYRGHKVFRTVFLPAGDYTGSNRLTLYFMPVSFKMGLLFTCLSVLMLSGLYAVRALKGGQK